MENLSNLLRRATAAALGRTGVLLRKCGTAIYQAPKSSSTQQDQALAKWYADRGDGTLRLDYDLTSRSVVFDLGGYEGQWTSDIFARFCCRVYVFEPVEAFARRLRQRFLKNSQVTIYDFGLANITTEARIGVLDNCSSILKESGESEVIELIKASDFLDQANIVLIDLMKINIEGSEYDLLDHLVDTGKIRCISNIQVQFHNFFPDAETRMERIQARLSETHTLTWQYRFVWENWQLNI